MTKAERPFPPARDFDLSQSIRVETDFNINTEIPLPFRSLVNFLNEQQGWVMDVGKTRVALYEDVGDSPSLGTAIQFSWFGQERRVALDFIPRRTETMEFARKTLGELLPCQTYMYRVRTTDFNDKPNLSISFESLDSSAAGSVRLKVTMDLESGSVSREEEIHPKK